MTMTECPPDTGHVTLNVIAREWHCIHVEPCIWFSEPGMRSIAPSTDSLWTRWDDYIKLEAANGTWIWKFTGRTCINRFAGNTLHEARWPD